ncbi:MAG: hypothetical protein QM775_36300 [Pirellulales bacterium]
MVWHAAVRGFTPLYAVLLLVGLVVEGRRNVSAARLPVWIVTLLTLAGIWTHAWYAGLVSWRATCCRWSSHRPALRPSVFSRRCAAFRTSARRRRPAWRPAWSAAMLTTVVVLYGCIDAFKTSYAGRLETARLGTWIRDQYGPGRRIYGGDAQLELLGFYAEADCFRIPAYTATPEIAAAQIVDVRPDIILLSSPMSAETRRQLQIVASQRGFVAKPGPSARRPVEILASADAQSATRR